MNFVYADPARVVPGSKLFYPLDCIFFLQKIIALFEKEIPCP
jgi:hypothetical protein